MGKYCLHIYIKFQQFKCLKLTKSMKVLSWWHTDTLSQSFSPGTDLPSDVRHWYWPAKCEYSVSCSPGSSHWPQTPPQSGRPTSSILCPSQYLRPTSSILCPSKYLRPTSSILSPAQYLTNISPSDSGVTLSTLRKSSTIIFSPNRWE